MKKHTKSHHSATNEVLSLLERKYAMRVLVAIFCSGPQSALGLTKGFAANPKTINARITDLRNAGLIEYRAAPDGWVLTAIGDDLARRLNTLISAALAALAAAKQGEILCQR